MKLKDCKMGILVITEDLKVGHIIGLDYNCRVESIGGMDNEELLSRTVPVVKFPVRQVSIHHSNLSIFKG